MTELETRLSKITDALVDAIDNSIGESVASIALTGSYSQQKYSSEKPDINLIIAHRPDLGAKGFLALGDALIACGKQFLPEISLRYEFRPFKYPYPYSKEGFEVTVNPILLNLGEAHGDFPFGLPKNFLAGIRSMQVVLKGQDVLHEMDLAFDKAYIIKASLRDLSIFRLQLTRSPLCYDLSRDVDLFFNEALSIGKMVMGFGIEIASTDQQIASEEYLKYFADKPLMIEFFREQYGEESAQSASLILDARANYQEWKRDIEKAKAVFEAAHSLLGVVWALLMQSLQTH